MSAAKERHEIQRIADKRHHESRVEWLSNKPCRWADGTVMSEQERIEMLAKSNECLRLINDFGMSTNHANIEDYK